MEFDNLRFFSGGSGDLGLSSSSESDFLMHPSWEATDIRRGLPSTMSCRSSLPGVNPSHLKVTKNSRKIVSNFILYVKK